MKDHNQSEGISHGNGNGGGIEKTNPTEPGAGLRKLVWWLVGLLALATLLYYLFNFFQASRRTGDFVRQVKILVVDSPTVGSILGEPVQVIEPHTLTTGKDDFQLQLRLKGQEGEGKVTVTGRLKTHPNKFVEYVRESMKLEFNGQQFDINPDAELLPDVEIDFGN
jgi:hypothetical protein